MTLADFLEDRGFEVIETATAAEAIEVLRTSAKRIDLVFSDVRMPGDMDGFELAAWLQVNHQGLPVILTSGDIGQANVARKVFSGERFLPKPYDLPMVARQITEVIRAIAA